MPLLKPQLWIEQFPELTVVETEIDWTVTDRTESDPIQIELLVLFLIVTHICS